jgi:hypothetical protein
MSSGQIGALGTPPAHAIGVLNDLLDRISDLRSDYASYLAEYAHVTSPEVPLCCERTDHTGAVVLCDARTGVPLTEEQREHQQLKDDLLCLRAPYLTKSSWHPSSNRPIQRRMVTWRQGLMEVVERLRGIEAKEAMPGATEQDLPLLLLPFLPGEDALLGKFDRTIATVKLFLARWSFETERQTGRGHRRAGIRVPAKLTIDLQTLRDSGLTRADFAARSGVKDSKTWLKLLRGDPADRVSPETVKGANAMVELLRKQEPHRFSEEPAARSGS